MTGKTVVEPETVTFSFATEEAETAMADKASKEIKQFFLINSPMFY